MLPVVRQALLLLLGVLTLGAGVQRAAAADVTIEVSTRETWVGIPFIVRITVSDAERFEDPTFPAVDGLEVMGAPHRAQQSMTTIVNGRMVSQKSVTLSWSVVPTRSGRFRIPGVAVEADGEVFESRPIDITAQESEAGDDVLVAVNAPRERYYLGERIPLVLEVWIKPFIDEASGRTFDARTMMGRIDARRSLWGVFADDIADVDVGEAERADDDGVPIRYYVIRLEGTHAPAVPGPVALDDVRILVDYPEVLRERRDFFGRQSVEIARSRPIVVAPPPSTVTVLPLPEIGRPPTFTGAVGRFGFEVSASATEVTVGDPIELTMTVSDRTPAGGRLDVLQAPAIHLDAALTEHFRVPEETIPGTVNGARKTFQQTIRATTDAIDAIPAMTFAFFDPEAERYDVAMSEPIPLRVAPATTVSLTEVVTAADATGNGTPGGGTTLTAVSGGIIAAYDDTGALLATTRPAPGSRFWIAMAAPPVAWCLLAGVHRHRRRRRDDPAAVRRRGARSAALRRLRDAADAAAVAAAVRGYVADRTGLSDRAVTGSEAVAQLGRSGVNGSVMEEVERLLVDCDQAVFAGGAAGGDLAERAAACIGRLEKERLR